MAWRILSDFVESPQDSPEYKMGEALADLSHESYIRTVLQPKAVSQALWDLEWLGATYWPFSFFTSLPSLTSSLGV